MNRTKIEYCDYSWNPITGCHNGCPYCYARKIANRFHGGFKPKFHPDRLEQPRKVKKPSTIFACDMGDIFSKGVKWEWLEKVTSEAGRNEQHKFLFLTKNPEGYSNSPWYGNTWQGVSITHDGESSKALLLPDNNPRWISFEPLLGPVNIVVKVDWIVIGRATNYKHEWNPEWVEDLKSQAERKKIPVFIKSNVNQ